MFISPFSAGMSTTIPITFIRQKGILRAIMTLFLSLFERILTKSRIIFSNWNFLFVENRDWKIASGNVAGWVLSLPTILLCKLRNAFFHVQLQFVHGNFSIAIISLAIQSL